MTKNFSSEFNKSLIAKLSEHRDDFAKNEHAVWQRIALELAEADGAEVQRWQDLSLYFKRSLVFKLTHTKFTDDQELVDWLQYPYLRKVYSVTIQFVKKTPPDVVKRKDLIEDDLNFIKFSLNGVYDPAVVKTFKRRSCKGSRNYVVINVDDPSYNLTPEQRLLLLQIEQNRTRHNKQGRQVEPGTWQDAATGSVASTVPSQERSVRRLLEEESLDINSQEYAEIMKETPENDMPLPAAKTRKSGGAVSSLTGSGATGSELIGEEIVWVGANEELGESSLANVSRDPLQLSTRSTVGSSQASPDDAGVGAQEKDSTTSEPLFTPSSGESAKTVADKSHEGTKEGGGVRDQQVPQDLRVAENLVAKSQPPTLLMAKEVSNAYHTASVKDKRAFWRALFRTASDSESESENETEEAPPIVQSVAESSVRAETEAASTIQVTVASIESSSTVVEPRGSDSDCAISQSDLTNSSIQTVIHQTPKAIPNLVTRPHLPEWLVNEARDSEDDDEVPDVAADEMTEHHASEPSADAALAEGSSGSTNTPEVAVETTNSGVDGEPVDSGSVTRGVMPSDDGDGAQVGEKAADDANKPCSPESASVPPALSHHDEDRIQENLNGGSYCSGYEQERAQPLNSRKQVTQRNRWFVQHQVLEPIIDKRLDLLAILRVRMPNLFRPTETLKVSELYALSSTFTTTLFGDLLLEPIEIGRVFERQAMVQALVVRMAFGLSPSELKQQSSPPALIASRKRPAVAEFVVPVPDAGGSSSPPPKRMKIHLSFVD